MRVVFFGTPAVAVPPLDALVDSRHEVVAVVTQPDRPQGRSRRPVPPPLKERATQAALSVLQPDTPRADGFAESLAAFAPDVCAVVAYGHILPREVLAIPARGFVNVHFSLLPGYRGAAPVQRAIMAGETETGVTTFLLEPTLDTGPILLVASEPITPDDTSGTLMERLAHIGGRLLVETLDRLEAGTLSPRTQDASRATPAPKIMPEEGLVDWSRSVGEIVNLVRALNPAPGAYSTFRGKRLKVWKATEAGRVTSDATPGTIVDLGSDRVAVRAGDGVIELLEVQLEGHKRLAAGDFVHGQRPRAGEVLGD